MASDPMKWLQIGAWKRKGMKQRKEEKRKGKEIGMTTAGMPACCFKCLMPPPLSHDVSRCCCFNPAAAVCSDVQDLPHHRNPDMQVTSTRCTAAHT
jgi:hypothetical protein